MKVEQFEEARILLGGIHHLKQNLDHFNKFLKYVEKEEQVSVATRWGMDVSILLPTEKVVTLVQQEKERVEKQLKEEEEKFRNL